MESPASRASPWHHGELALQRRLGVEQRMEEAGRRMVRDHLIEQHREFFPLLPMVVLGSVDPSGDAWATLRDGRPGFLHAPDPARLSVELERDFADSAEAGMEDGSAIGLLGIDLGTRRRNRLNGTLRRRAGGFDLAVGHSFGNCPKYIQLRRVRFLREPQTPSLTAPEESTTLHGAARVLVEQADTFFVASFIDREGERQVDVSHRGGRAGFVRVDEEGRLVIPDFVGNRFFNTLGNIMLNPRAGLTFPDFATGGLLQMTGDAELLFDPPEDRSVEGAERYWRFNPRRIIWRVDALAVRYDLEEWSPHTLMTGI
ncbi:pyridoxamine 5'-phosphate oxidase family protein [Novosphingobium sp.]|uniref:pyridoxamine 5'-phosphate oxidase family protein n=1 Tax=Novosphingobium sp. TaxID=1874826 RepID=UPI002B47C474|nr:pyridoxamine 5'-phosphate oxidase family protein [Novosphingobium sp.]HKR92831.1 pyridoxamine 5'-phosphate oxidase family protein [Novosphingobium sp.]